MLLRSCRDVQRPRHLPNAKTAAILQSHPDETTKIQNILFRRPADRGGVQRSSKKTKKNAFFHQYDPMIPPSYPISSTHHHPKIRSSHMNTYQVHHTAYVHKIQPHLLACYSFGHGEERGVAFSCCRVPLPRFPWPIQNRLSNAQSLERLSGNAGPNVPPKRLASHE